MRERIRNTMLEKKEDIYQIKNLCGKHENKISSILFNILNWSVENKEYTGLFGWDQFKTDKCLRIGNKTAIIEIKKIIEKTEYGFWHSLIQALIYAFKEGNQEINELIFLCIVLDWGRKSGQVLNDEEKRFLNIFTCKGIRVIRISLVNSFFIEHNLSNDWEVIY